MSDFKIRNTKVRILELRQIQIYVMKSLIYIRIGNIELSVMNTYVSLQPIIREKSFKTIHFTQCSL